MEMAENLCRRVQLHINFLILRMVVTFIIDSFRTLFESSFESSQDKEDRLVEWKFYREYRLDYFFFFSFSLWCIFGGSNKIKVTINSFIFVNWSFFPCFVYSHIERFFFPLSVLSFFFFTLIFFHPIYLSLFKLRLFLSFLCLFLLSFVCPFFCSIFISFTLSWLVCLLTLFCRGCSRTRLAGRHWRHRGWVDADCHRTLRGCCTWYRGHSWCLWRCRRWSSRWSWCLWRWGVCSRHRWSWCLWRWGVCSRHCAYSRKRTRYSCTVAG